MRATGALAVAVAVVCGALVPAISPAGAAPAPVGLFASNGATGDQFGSSTAISGTTALVGAPSRNAVYVFTEISGVWSQSQELSAGGGFGAAVAISGNTAVVGTNNGNAAYLFTRNSTGVWSQSQELTALDVNPLDYFGTAVAIAGSVAVVGAWGHGSTGAAYVFTRGRGGVWGFDAELNGDTSDDNFGSSVAVSGSTIAVGAPNGAGEAYVFTENAPGAWVQSAVETGVTVGSLFGASVAVSTNTLVVGAPANFNTPGVVYVFTRNATTGVWSQNAELVAGGAATSLARSGAPDKNSFGSSVGLSGGTIVIGADNVGGGPGFADGAVYVFKGSGATWKLSGEFDAGGEGQLGAAVAVSGATAVVGAPNLSPSGTNSGTGGAYVIPTTLAVHQELSDSAGYVNLQFGESVASTGTATLVGVPNGPGDSGTGEVDVFRENTGTGVWSQSTELTASNGTGGDQFGSSIAISGTTAVVGADDGNSGTGAAYVFTEDSSTGVWSQSAELTAPDGAGGDNFGATVAISGNVAIVGADGRGGSTGAAYVFIRSTTGAWSLTSELAPSDGAQGDLFGYSVAISGTSALVGSLYHNGLAGAVYAFTSSRGSWTQTAELSVPGSTYFGASVAISGTTAVIGGYSFVAQTGAAYVFSKIPVTGWTEQAELNPSGGSNTNDQSGTNTVAISGSLIVLGLSARNSNTGAAVVFKKNGSTGVWSQSAELTAPDGAPGDNFGSALAFSGTTAWVGAYGNSGSGAVYALPV